MKRFSKAMVVLEKYQAVSLPRKNIPVFEMSSPLPRPSPQGEGETHPASLGKPVTGFIGKFVDQNMGIYRCSLSRRERVRVRGNAADWRGASLNHKSFYV